MTGPDMVRRIAAGYGLPLADYRRHSAGLLIGSGCGIMMAVMDECPCYRWCFDQDEVPGGFDLAGVLAWLSRYCSPVGLAGWFTVSDPARIAAALRELPVPPLVYAGHRHLGVGAEAASLADFIRLSNAARTPSAEPTTTATPRSSAARPAGGFP